MTPPPTVKQARAADTRFAQLAIVLLILLTLIGVWLVRDQMRLLSDVRKLQTETLSQTIKQQKLARNVDELRLQGERVLSSDTPEERAQALVLVNMLANSPGFATNARIATLAADAERFLNTREIQDHSGKPNEATRAEWRELALNLSQLAGDVSSAGLSLGTTDLKAMEDLIELSQRKLLVAILIIVFFMLGTLLLIRRQFVTPLRHIHRAINCIEQGVGQAPMSGSDFKEFQSIDSAIHRLGDTLKEKATAQRELALRDNILRTILATSLDGFWRVDVQGRLLEVNQTYCQQSGYSCEELLGLAIGDIEVNESAADTAKHIRLIIETGSDQFESRHRRMDGSIWDVEVSATYEDVAGGQFYVFLRDITERKRAEAELKVAKTLAEAANLSKSRFLAAASHDLRQPMQAISLFVHSLARTDLSEDQKPLSRYLTAATQALGELLNAILDLSKLNAGLVKPDLAIISIDALFAAIDAEFSLIAAKKSLRFKLSFPFGDMLASDRQLLKRLLCNLIDNAIKYTEQGGILVAIRRRGNKALIQVWDTGCGIAPEHQGRIFEEYFQVGNPERDNAKGLGLGLAITQRIAKLLNTEVVCRSRLGKGSVFEFRLPLATGVESTPSSRSELLEVTPLDKSTTRHVVVLEDNLLVTIATKTALESCGICVTHYKTAEEALADTGIAAADFYIADLWLPGMNGSEFLDAVQRRTTKPIKAVILTGDLEAQNNEHLRATSWQLLFKPVDLSTLLSAIRSQDLGD
jgi:PAS domain S-box-containing protein